MPEILILIIVLAVLFDIANGWHDCANAIATVVSTKVMSRRRRYAAAFMNILGAFLTTAVAKTIGKGIVDPVAITDHVIIAALLSAILWNLITILMAFRSAHPRALGGLIGAARRTRRRDPEQRGIISIFTSSPLAIFGFIIGFGS